MNLDYYGPFEPATLRDLLCMRKASELAKLAKMLTNAPIPAKVDDRIQLLLDLVAKFGLRALWDRFDPAAQAILTEIIYGESRYFDEGRFAARYADVLPEWAERFTIDPGKQSTSLLDLLCCHDTVPDDIREELLQFVPPPPKPKLTILEEVPHFIQFEEVASKNFPDGAEVIPVISEAAALHDVLSVLHLIGNGKIAVNSPPKKKSRAAKEELPQTNKTGASALLKVLHAGDSTDAPFNRVADAIRPFAWIRLLQAGGLVTATKTRFQLTRAGQQALAKTPQEIILALWEAWLSTRDADESLRIDPSLNQSHVKLSPPPRRREAILRGLSECPPGAWITMSSFLNYLRASGYGFSIRVSYFFNEEDDYDYDESEYDEWPGTGLGDHLNERYVAAFLWEYAATLGLLDILALPTAYVKEMNRREWSVAGAENIQRFDGLTAFRITPLGAYCLGLSPAYTPPAHECYALFHVLPNADIVLRDPEACTPVDTATLGRFAVRHGDHSWQLSIKSVLDALETGFSKTQILDFLTARSDAPLPDTVLHLIEDTARRAASVVCTGLVSLYEAVDETTALLIAHDKEGRKYCFHAGANRLAVPHGQVRKFRTALRKLGILVSIAHE
ncbi:MAG: helicase-associated domain-containing protein [Candidatus Hydrogenedentes bacterium]|nr:helicase-associated domain-containing protein [Candidatus Hydrogenedentota bacterium]